MTQHSVSGMTSDSEDGDISVGCPSPVLAVEEEETEGKRPRSDDDDRKEVGDEYFKPLKKLKMMTLNRKRREEDRSTSPAGQIPFGKPYPIHKGHMPTTSRLESDGELSPGMGIGIPPFAGLNMVPAAHMGIPIPIPVALRHFPTPGVMLLDNRNILEHRQLLERNLYLENRHLFERNLVENRFLMNPAHMLTAADTRHLLTPEQRSLLGIENRFLDAKNLIDQRQILEARLLESSRLGLDPTRDSEVNTNGVKSFSILDILNHRPRKEETKTDAGGKIVRPWAEKAEKPTDLCYSETLSTCSSERSSTAGSVAGSASECCTSPDIINCSVSGTSGGTSRQQRSGKAAAGSGKNTSPLDALFQMTSKTFDGMNGEPSTDGQANHLHLFNNRQQPKKKRKSRTAFTNHQIFELEKRFLYQKYLSPADRDEIAGALGLSNAQVITWFQNRRAKLKRDMEELKKDVESAKILTAHKSFLENVQDLGILKKKNVSSHSDDEKNCSVPSLVIPTVSTSN